MNPSNVKRILQWALVGCALAFPLGASADAGGKAGAAKADKAESKPAAEVPAAANLQGVVNINTASEAELQQLPGVGATRAAAIIALRKQKPFEKVEDVMKVKGIGRATFKRLRGNLSVQGPTTAKPAGTAATKRGQDKP